MDTLLQSETLLTADTLKVVQWGTDDKLTYMPMHVRFYVVTGHF